MPIAKEKKEGVKEVEKLVRNEKYKEAYSLCNKLLLNFPESLRLVRLQKKIEKIVFKKNLSSVKQDLKQLKPLWNEKKYEELVEKLKVLQGYVPGYASVEKQLFKAQNLLQKQQIESQKDTLAQYIKNIEENIKNAKYQDAIITCKQVLQKIPNHQGANILLHKAKDLLIVQKIKENEYLLESKKFKEIDLFLNDLLKINPDSTKVKNLIKKVAKKERISLEFERRDFSYRSYENILILYQKKKYEKTVKALKELLEVDPQNIKALELLKKAKRKFNRKLSTEVINKIRELQKKFKKQKRVMPKEFIKL